MRIALGADHAGYRLKERIAEHLGKGCRQNVAQGLMDALHDDLCKGKYEVVDFGTNSEDSVDYPDIGVKTAQAVSAGDCKYGILICGTGIGMSITANKIHGIRAALCCNTLMAQLCREHNDANILVLGARIITPETAIEMVDVFLTTDFAGSRHERRVAKIMELDDCRNAQKVDLCN